jgi:hypothetical protein
MTTQQVADRLVELCRMGNYRAAHEELYHPNAVSIEPAGHPAGRIEGIDAILKKGEEWGNSLVEVHSNQVSDPVVAGNYISLAMHTEATFKEYGRQTMEEICVYKVENGKVVEEQFFFSMDGAG